MITKKVKSKRAAINKKSLTGTVSSQIFALLALVHMAYVTADVLNVSIAFGTVGLYLPVDESVFVEQHGQG